MWVVLSNRKDSKNISKRKSEQQRTALAPATETMKPMRNFLSRHIYNVDRHSSYFFIRAASRKKRKTTE